MNKIISLLIISCCAFIAKAQVNNSQSFFAQSYSKEFTEQLSKRRVVEDLIKPENNQKIFYRVDAITASLSGELTTIVYECKEKNIEGIGFVFYGDYVNENGVYYKGYKFCYIDRIKAEKLFAELKYISDNKSDLVRPDKDSDSMKNNYAYKFEDITFIFTKNSAGSYMIRVLWDGFDSLWSTSNFKITKTRFEKFFMLEKK